MPQLQDLPVELVRQIVAELDDMPHVEDAAEHPPESFGEPLAGQLKHSNDTLDVWDSLESLGYCNRFFWQLIRPMRLCSFKFGQHDTNAVIEAQTSHYTPDMHEIIYFRADIDLDRKDDNDPFDPYALQERCRLLCTFVDGCEELADLNIDYLNNSFLHAAIANRRETLTKLTLVASFEDMLEGDMAELVGQLPYINSLKLSGFELNSHRVGDMRLRNAIASRAYLRHLRLNRCEAITDNFAGCTWLSESISRLELTNAISLSLASVTAILQCIGQKLKRLKASIHGHGTDTVTEYHMPRLTHLSLSGFHLSPEVLRRFGKSPIIKLALPYCFGAVPDASESVATVLSEKTFPQLQHLDLSKSAFWEDDEQCEQMIEKLEEGGLTFEITPPDDLLERGHSDLEAGEAESETDSDWDSDGN